MRQAIAEDIKDWRKGKFSLKTGNWSVSSHFVRVAGSSLWVYSHQGYVSASDAKYAHFNSCVTIMHLPPSLQRCSGDEHLILEPFFSDNMALQSLWADKPDLLQELKKVREDISTGMFAAQGFASMSGLDFNENTWTKRLVSCLERHLPTHTVSYTAEDATNFRNVQSRYSLLGNSPDIISCYVFHGCTDIRINDKVWPALGKGTIPCKM